MPVLSGVSIGVGTYATCINDLPDLVTSKIQLYALLHSTVDTLEDS